MNTHIKLLAETASLKHGTCMAYTDDLMSVWLQIKRGVSFLTVMGEVEAAVDPNLVFRDGLVLLRVYRPLTRQGNLLFKGSSAHLRNWSRIEAGKF